IKPSVTRLLCITVLSLLLSSCAGHEKAPNQVVHEPLTLMTAGRDYEQFALAFQKKHPEIQLDIISYSGCNPRAYMQKLLAAGQAPDIYTTTVLPDPELQKEFLVDLSVYDFSKQYVVSQLKDCTVDDAIYLLPSSYGIYGIYYNKTLFEAHNWTVPTSFQALQALAPEIQAAGVNLACADLSSAEAAFQFLFNLGSTVFLQTPDGIEWKENFLAGTASAQDAWKDTVAYVQKWIDLGMFKDYADGSDPAASEKHFREGNTAFFLHDDTFCFTQDADENGNQYGIIPWLSEDGSVNRFITNPFCYFGLSAELEKPQNNQKLQDALTFMEFISTAEGQQLLERKRCCLPTLIDDYTQTADDFFEVKEQLDAGYCAPRISAGWEGIIHPVNREALKWYAGEATGQQVISVMEQARTNALSGAPFAFAEIEESLTQEETARLVGAAFAEAAEADCALISLGGYHSGQENDLGVNGCLWRGPATEEIISTVCPLGRDGTIHRFTLSGDEIQELAEKGFDRHGDQNNFPYVLVTKNDVELKSSHIYSVVIAGYTKETLEAGDGCDTGINGMKALKEYLKNIRVVTPQS
ncbi:MAG: ABC transporter substrate-binding protein, partial [Clostridia bacterium]